MADVRHFAEMGAAGVHQRREALEVGRDTRTGPAVECSIVDEAGRPVGFVRVRLIDDEPEREPYWLMEWQPRQ